MISAGDGSDAFEPRHSTKGFQYVRIEGYDGALTVDDVTAVVVHTDFERRGAFACSDDRINAIHRIAEWSFRDNACDIPTDCPTRERAGWTGDWQIYVETAAFLYDVGGFSVKWLRDLAAEQRPDGKVTNLVPESHPRRRPAAELLARSSRGRRAGATPAVHVPWIVVPDHRRPAGARRPVASMTAWVDYAAAHAATAPAPVTGRTVGRAAAARAVRLGHRLALRRVARGGRRARRRDRDRDDRRPRRRSPPRICTAPRASSPTSPRSSAATTTRDRYARARRERRRRRGDSEFLARRRHDHTGHAGDVRARPDVRLDPGRTPRRVGRTGSSSSSAPRATTSAPASSPRRSCSRSSPTPAISTSRTSCCSRTRSRRGSSWSTAVPPPCGRNGAASTPTASRTRRSTTTARARSSRSCTSTSPDSRSSNPATGASASRHDPAADSSGRRRRTTARTDASTSDGNNTTSGSTVDVTVPPGTTAEVVLPTGHHDAHERPPHRHFVTRPP